MLNFKLVSINLSDNYMISQGGWKNFFKGLMRYSASSLKEVQLNNCWFEEHSIIGALDGFTEGIA